MALTKISTGMLKQDAASSDLNIDAGTLYLDVSNNRVGINKTSPSTTLDVVGTAVFGAGTTRLTTYSDSGYSGIYNGSSLTSDESIYMGGGNTFFYTDNAERMRLNSTGLGIGVSNPATKLHVNGGTTQAAKFQTNSSSVQIGEFSSGAVIWLDGSDGDLSGGDYFGIHALSTTDLSFSYAGGIHMTLKNDGKLGIGTASPDAKLSVTSSTINSEDILYLKSGADNVNDYLGIAWELGVGGNGPHSAIRSFAGPSGSDARLGFLTTSNGGTTLTEGLSVAHNGNVGIGTTNPTDPLVVHSSGASMGGGATLTNSYFTITDGTTSMFHDPNELFSNINGSFHIGATHANGYLRFHTGGTSIRMVILADGNVGIGTTSPSSFVESSRFVVGSGTSGTNEMMFLYSGTDTFGAIGFADGTSGTARYKGIIGYHHDGDEMFFSTNGGGEADRDVTITSAGNVGIGDTNPSALRLSVVTPTANHIGLQVVNSNTADSFGMVVKGGNDANDYTADFRKRDNTNIMRIRGDGNVGIGQTSFGVNGKLQVTGGISTTGNSEIRQSTNSDGSTLRFLGTQFVAGPGNSHSYSYSGGGLIASVSPSAGAIMLDVGANSTSGHRLKVINAGDGIAGSLQYLSGTTSRFHVDSSTGKVGIGTASPNAFLSVRKDNNNSGNQFIVADTEGASPGVRTYTHGGDDSGLILNHYYAVGGSGNEYMRYADFVANVGNGAGTTMRFITKNAANTYSTTVIDNEGNVGIGTTAPNAKLQVAGNTGIRILNSASTQQADFIPEGSNLSIANFFASGSTISFKTNPNSGSVTERMRIDASGNLLVGKTSAGFANTGHELRGGGAYAAFTREGTPVLVNRKSSDGALVEYMKDGTTIGSLSTKSDDLVIHSSITNHSGLSFSDGSILPTNNYGTTSTNTVDLGSSSRKFKHLYLSGTVNAVQLDITAGTDAKIYTSNSISEVGNGNFAIQSVNTAGSALKPLGFRAEDIRFATGSAERLRIDTSGNVGILQTSPSSYYAKNLVVGAGTAEEGITIRGANNGRSYLMFADGTSGNERYRGYFSYNHSIDAFEFATGGAQQAVLTSAGKLGIGTTSPDHPLEVVGVISSADTGIQKSTFENAGNDLVITANKGQTNVASNIIFKSSQSGGTSTERMRISNLGNVGINTSNPYGGTGVTSMTVNAANYPVVSLKRADGHIFQIFGYYNHTTLNASVGWMQFDTGGAERMRISSDGYVSLNRGANEYGLELKSAGTRSGLVLKKPGTDSIMGSLLMLADESYRLGTASHYHQEMLQNGYTRQKTPQGTTFTITQSFTCTGSSVTRHVINLASVLGASTAGALRYEVSAVGYGSGGTNGVNAKYSVAGYSGHSYSATNYGSFGAGTIQNGYKSSNSTSYDARGISYHPCINMGSYIADGEIYAYVPAAQQYGFTVSNDNSNSFGMTIIITGFYT